MLPSCSDYVINKPPRGFLLEGEGPGLSRRALPPFVYCRAFVATQIETLRVFKLICAYKTRRRGRRGLIGLL